MGSGSSCLSPVAPLNAASSDEDGGQGLLEKLASQPALLSKPVPGLSVLLGGVAQTWLHVACERKQIHVVRRMLQFLSTSSPATVREALGPYCRRNGLALPESAAEGVRLAVSMCNGRGQTPLMHACYAGCAELVKFLLDKGANPWSTDRCGCRTALHYASIAGCAACVAALLQCAAAQQLSNNGYRYVDARSVSGLTPLHYAVYYERHGVLRELLRHDPDINAATSCSSYDIWLDCDAASTPLHFAALRGNSVAVQELLRFFASRRHTGEVADPRLARNSSGRQPWHLAATQYPSLRYLTVLLQPGQPLTRVAGVEESGQSTHLGAPPLAVIAAAALRHKLLDSVAAAEAAAAATAAAAAAAPGSKKAVGLAATASSGSTQDPSPLSGVSRTRCGSAPGSPCPPSRASKCEATSGSAVVVGAAGSRLAPSHPLSDLYRDADDPPSTCNGGSDRRRSRSGLFATARCGSSLGRSFSPNAGPSAGAHPTGSPASPGRSLSVSASTPCMSAHTVSHRWTPRGGGGLAAGSTDSAPPSPPPPGSTCPGEGQVLAVRPSRHSMRDLSADQHPFGVPAASLRLSLSDMQLGSAPDLASLPAGGAGSAASAAADAAGRSIRGEPGLHRCNTSLRAARSAARDGERHRLQPPCFGHFHTSDGFVPAAAAAAAGMAEPLSPRPPTHKSLAAAAATSGSDKRLPAGCRQRDGGGGGENQQGSSAQRGGADDAPPAGAAAAAAAAVPGAALTVAATAAVCSEMDDDEAEGTCHVCFVRRQTVAPEGCRHGLCGACARELCHGLTCRPLLCPFCRQPVGAFMGLAAHGQVGGCSGEGSWLQR